MEPKRKLSDTTVAIIIIASILILVVGISIAIGMIFGPSCNPNQGTPQVTSPPGGVVFDPNAGNKVDDPENSTPQRPNIAIPGWATLTMPPNTTEITVDFYNPEANAGYYHMTFELRLVDETKPEGYEVLYTSGLVEAGKHIQKITLSRGLEPGTYQGYIHVQPYFADSMQPTNNANTMIEIIVK